MVWVACFLGGQLALRVARRSGDPARELRTRRALRPWLVVEHVAFLTVLCSGAGLLQLRGWSLSRARWLGFKVGLVTSLLLPLEAIHAWICHWWIAPGLDETGTGPVARRLQRGASMDEMLRSLALPLLALALPLLVWLSVARPG